MILISMLLNIQLLHSILVMAPMTLMLITQHLRMMILDDGQYELTGLQPGTLYFITIFIVCPYEGALSPLQNPVNFVTLDSSCPDPENLVSFDPTPDGFDVIGSPNELYSTYTVKVWCKIMH